MTASTRDASARHARAFAGRWGWWRESVSYINAHKLYPKSALGQTLPEPVKPDGAQAQAQLSARGLGPISIGAGPLA
jgi:hypothetical protein